MFRKVVLTSPVVFGAVAVTQKAPVESKEASLAHYQCKPSDLPVYAPLHSLTKKEPKCPHPHQPKQAAPIQALECGIRTVRVEVFNVCNALSEQKKNFDDVLETGRAHTQTTIDYLNEPANTMPRVGAIAIGGLAGMIFAVRGGFIKKVLYTGVGAGGIASLCYPKEAEHYGQIALQEAKKNFAIGYNFAMGIKPDDSNKKLPEAVSKFPTSLRIFLI
uniref:MICOS complex subunit n=1 Tax=Megaselia scalaris TaxID=36166 RepID=T1GYV7_MEGSC